MYKWSISYPRDWTLDAKDPTFVKIQSPPNLSGLVGIHSRAGDAGKTLDEVVDAYLDGWTREMTRRGTGTQVVSRRRGVLRDGTPTVEVVHLMGTGVVGKSRKVIASSGGHWFLVDAETYLSSWPALEAHFEPILKSFALVPPAGRAAVAPEAPRLFPASTVLIPGVPFISFREAARLDYEQKALVHPSFPAAEAMTLRYWGQDLSLQRDRVTFARWGVAEAGSADSLDQLKRYIDRRIPVFVAPALTWVADTPSPLVAVLASRGMKESDIRTTTEAQLNELQTSWVDWIRRAPWISGVLGRMEHLDTFQRLWDSTGMSPWETTRGSGRVVIGYDDDRKTIVLHDPSFGPAWEVTYENFEAMWSATKRWYAVAYPHDYAEVVATRPPAGSYAPQSPDQQAAARYVLGYALASVGRDAEAEKELERGLSIPGMSRGYRHLFLLELAWVYRRRGNISKAISVAEEAADLLPEHHRPWELLAHLYRASRSQDWQQKAQSAQARTQKLCSDGAADRAIEKALARDFNVYGCVIGKLLIAPD